MGSLEECCEEKSTKAWKIESPSRYRVCILKNDEEKGKVMKRQTNNTQSGGQQTCILKYEGFLGQQKSCHHNKA